MTLALLGALALAADLSFEDDSEALAGVRIVSLDVRGTGYSGIGVFDYDNDGDLDLYFGNGPTQDNALLRNDGGGAFTNVSIAANAAVGTGTTGVLTADLDGDGYPDLVLPGDRSSLNVLMNLGDGTFGRATSVVGITGAFRNMSAHAADIDNDSDLDVFVLGGTTPDAQHANTLFVNDGTGRFTERGVAAGVGTEVGACAATFTHIDDDAFIDLIVANCADIDLLPTPFEVYRNRGDGTFEDRYDAAQVWAMGHWMGLAFADFDGDGLLDFFSTNTGMPGGDPHALYRANGDGTWTDVAKEVGVADWEFGWGAVALDADNDGWDDLFYVGSAHWAPYRKSPGHLFRNAGHGVFEAPVQPRPLTDRWTSGLAVGDLDNNGFEDLIIASTEAPDEGFPGLPVLLRNQGNGNHWLTVRLRGTTDNGAGIGARIRAAVGGRVLLREVQAGSSFMSTNTPWPTFGLGQATEARVCVRWPSGDGEDFGALAADQLVELVQGQGLGAVPCTHASLLPPVRTTGDTGTPAEPDHPDPEDRCGCATSGPVGAWLWLAPLLLWGCRTQSSPTDPPPPETGATGSTTGTTGTTGDTGPPPPRVHSLADAQAKLLGEADGDWAAKMAGVGDVDGDGFDDVVVGAVWHDDPHEDAGAAYLLSGPLSGRVSLSTAVAKRTGTAEDDWTGVSVAAAGDLNADGFDDFVVGADGFSGTARHTGGAFVFLGPQTGTSEITTADAVFLGARAFDLAGVTVGGRADTDGDGVLELLVGSRFHDAGGDQAGALYIAPWAGPGTFFLEQHAAKLIGEEAMDWLGLGHGATDLDGDGLDDIAVGAYQNDAGGTDAGAGYVVYGPLPARLDLSQADAILVGEAPGDFAAFEISGGGDLDGDGREDLLVGAERHDEGRGALYGLFGPVRGVHSLAVADLAWVGEAPGDGAGDDFIGDVDVNGDGRHDVAVAAQFESSAHLGAGALYLDVGPFGGTMSLADAERKYVGEGEGQRTWQVEAAGDIDGDGLDDVLMSSRYDSEAAVEAGAVYAVRGHGL